LITIFMMALGSKSEGQSQAVPHVLNLCQGPAAMQDGCAVTRWAPQALAGAGRWMLDQREIWEQRLDRMQDYVEGLATNKEKP
jgi:hypothetical protein